MTEPVPEPTSTALPTHPPGVAFDPELQLLVRISAWAGRHGRESAPVSFTSLFAAFLLAPDAVSRSVKRFAKSEGVETDAIRATMNLLEGDARGNVMRRANAGELPDAKDLYSATARSVFGRAAEYAQAGASDAVGVRHIVAAYLLEPPSYKSEELLRWRIEPKNWGPAMLRFMLRRFPRETIWQQLAKEHDVEPPGDILADFNLAPRAREAMDIAQHVGALRRDGSDNLTTTLVIVGVAVLGDQSDSVVFSSARAFTRALSEASPDWRDRLKDYFRDDVWTQPASDPPVMLGEVSENVVEILKNTTTLQRLDMEKGQIRPPDAPILTGDLIASIRESDHASRRLREMGVEDTDLFWDAYHRSLGSTDDDRQPRPIAADKGTQTPEDDSEFLLQTLEGHYQAVFTVAMSDNGRVILSGGDDGSVRRWNAETGEEFRTHADRNDPVTAVALAAGGSIMASAGLDGDVSHGDVGGPLTLIESEEVCHAVSMEDGGSLLAAAYSDGDVCLYDMRFDPPMTLKLEGHQGAVGAVAMADAGDLLISGSVDATIRFWDPPTRRTTHTLEPNAGAVNAIAVTRDGAVVLTGHDDGTLHHWVKTESRVGEFEVLTDHKGAVTGVAMSANAKLAISSSRDETVRIWNLDTGECLRVLRAHKGPVHGVAMSADGRRAASAGEDGKVLIWDLSKWVDGASEPEQDSDDEERLASEAEMEAQLGKSTSHVIGDVVGANQTDTIGMIHEAEAFARLSASRTLTPPLAVGVFGEWGSGKSFFMERVSEHVAALGKLAKDDEVANRHFHNTDEIVQIRFNAWHYMDQNLWASLADHIFCKLDEHLAPKEADTVFSRLESAQELRLEAAESFLQATRRTREAQQQHAEARARHREAIRKRTAADAAKDIWQAFLDKLATPQGTNPTDEEQKEAEALRTQASSAAKVLGLPKLGESVEALQRAVRDAAGTAGDTRVVAAALRRRLGRHWWLVALLAVGLGVAALVASRFLWSVFSSSEEPMSVVRDVVTGLAASITVVTGLIGAAASRAYWVLGKLKAAQSTIDASAQEVRDKFLAKPETELAAAKAAVSAAEQYLEETRTQARQAALDFAEETGPARLHRFIQDTVAKGEYSKHLSIVARLRRDFETLSAMMSGEQAGGRRGDPAALSKPFEDRVDELLAKHEHWLGATDTSTRTSIREKILGPGAGEPAAADDAGAGSTTVGRVLLYIDDLDRCPTDKVVDVLQAVHLLLNFRLFVVFVAVDSRWISRSLSKEYKGLLDAERSDLSASPAANNDEPPPGATTHDYLEKIFQIPYWVRPMDEEGGEKFIAGLIGKAQQAVARAQASPAADQTGDTNDKPAQPASAGDAVAETQPATRSSPGAAQSETPAVTPVATATQPVTTTPAPSGDRNRPEPEQAPKADPISKAPKERDDDDEGRDEQQGAQTSSQGRLTRQNSGYETLELTQFERDLITRLSPIVCRSPRRALRFFNVYRVLRSARSEQDAGNTTGADREAAHRAILTHLAVLVAAPSITKRYYAILVTMRYLLDSDDKATPPPTLANLREQLDDAFDHADTPATPDERERVLGAIDAIAEQLTPDDDSAESRRLVAEMVEHEQVARRYSFVGAGL